MDLNREAYYQDVTEQLKQERAEELNERIKSNLDVDTAIYTGKMCMRFMDSDLGRFLLDRATEDAQNAKDELAIIDHNNYDTTDKYLLAIRDLQQRANVPALIFTWLVEAIKAAEEVELTFNEKDYT